jgi:hypothetical protein
MEWASQDEKNSAAFETRCSRSTKVTGTDEIYGREREWKKEVFSLFDRGHLTAGWLS